jgi:hypothetical protein
MIETKTLLTAMCGLVLVMNRADASPASATATKAIHPTIEFITEPISSSTVEDAWLEDHSDGAKGRATSVERLGLPITFAFVVSSERMWLRSNEYENDRRPASGHALVEAMLQHLTGSPSSKVLVVTYDGETRVTLPPTPISQLPSHPLGQVEEYGNDGRAIALGIRLGLDQLTTVTTPRKLLVIVGSGQGDPGTERTALDDLAYRARNESVEIVAVNYPLDYEGERQPSKSVLSGVTTIENVTSPKEATAVLQTILANTEDAYRIRIDARELAWDGKVRPVSLHVGEYTFGRRLLHLPRHASTRIEPQPLSSWRWPLLASAIAFLIALVAVIHRRS